MEHFGYIKANKLTEDYIVRQDMEQRGEVTNISKDDYNKNAFEIISENKKVYIKTIITLNENDNIGINKKFNNEEGYKNWATISSDLSTSKINNLFEDYKTRTNLINTIIDNIIETDSRGVVIDFSEAEIEKNALRFVIELAPRLKEYGITTGIVINDSSKKEDYINIVDYIIE